MMAAGVPFGEVCQTLGIPRSTVGQWFYGERAQQSKKTLDKRCPFCTRPSRKVDDPGAYSYLLGSYLGDGHLLMTQRIPLLTIACDIRYPGIIAEVGETMRSCGARTVGHRPQPGCTKVASSWMHWPCLLPQHGPGKKHDRPMVLTGWQQDIVDNFPERFLKGLFHSDGCRAMNRIVRGDRTYEYARYLFVNKSADIMGLCQQSLDRLEIPWQMCRPNMLSVARKGAVTTLDQLVGPKS